MKSKVYFSRIITPERVVDLYKALGKELNGNVAVKIHSGEKGNQNFLKPEFLKPMIDYVHGTVVECNTAYPGARNSTNKHKKLISEHGWDKLFKFDLLDEFSKDDVEIPIPGGKRLSKDILGGKINNYDSVLVLSHFKGHPMGGFGGALKQLSIGFASTRGKAYIHSAGKTTNQHTVWLKLPPQDAFLESMAEAAGAVHHKFKDNIVYISLMVNMSVDCDCCAVAEDPCLKDIGILASLDPVAIDQAAIDLVLLSKDRGVSHFMERVNSRNGTHTIEYAEEIGVGSTNYEIISIDK